MADATPKPVVTTSEPAIAEPTALPVDAATAEPVADSSAPQPDWGTIGLIGGVGAVGAAGLLAFRKHRRTDDDLAIDAEPTIAGPAPEPLVAPIAAAHREPSAAFAPIGATSFEQAAETGPTEDNPFLTRRNRLKRARFYDRRARLATEASEPDPQPQPASAPEREPQVTYVFGKDRPRALGAPVLRKV